MNVWNWMMLPGAFYPLYFLLANCVLFADDTNVFVSGKDENEAFKNANIALKWGTPLYGSKSISYILTWDNQSIYTF